MIKKTRIDLLLFTIFLSPLLFHIHNFRPRNLNYLNISIQRDQIILLKEYYYKALPRYSHTFLSKLNLTKNNRTIFTSLRHQTNNKNYINIPSNFLKLPYTSLTHSTKQFPIILEMLSLENSNVHRASFLPPTKYQSQKATHPLPLPLLLLLLCHSTLRGRRSS